MKYFISTIFLAIGLSTACTEVSKPGGDESGKTIYEVVFRENLAGPYEKWPTGANSFGFFYTYTDRGRGPEFSEEITLNEQNFITAQTIKGVNYRKVSIDERRPFVLCQGTVQLHGSQAFSMRLNNRQRISSVF